MNQQEAIQNHLTLMNELGTTLESKLIAQSELLITLWPLASSMLKRIVPSHDLRKIDGDGIVNQVLLEFSERYLLAGHCTINSSRKAKIVLNLMLRNKFLNEIRRLRTCGRKHELAMQSLENKEYQVTSAEESPEDVFAAQEFKELMRRYLRNTPHLLETYDQVCVGVSVHEIAAQTGFSRRSIERRKIQIRDLLSSFSQTS